MPANTEGDAVLQVVVRKNQVRIGKWFGVTFERTLRIPEDGRTYPLPPGLGRFPVRRVADVAESVPPEWRERGGVVIPMYQREALWLGFEGVTWHPCAVQVAVGGINAVSGAGWEEGLTAEPQNYLVCPDQPWLDGINAGEGVVRQFVAMPLGLGYTVEAQLAGKEDVGGIQIRVYEPKPGRFPEHPPPRRADAVRAQRLAGPKAPGAMGLGAGGTLRQKIYPDAYGPDTWDSTSFGSVSVQIVNSEQYRALTGRRPPRTPVSARTYTEYGFPWFDLYDEHTGDIQSSPRLGEVKTVRESEAERGGAAGQAEDEPVEIRLDQVSKLIPPDSGQPS
jgi:hypothetical protein